MDAKEDWILDWLAATGKVLDRTSKLLEDFVQHWKSIGAAAAAAENLDAYKGLCLSAHGKIVNAADGFTSLLDEIYPSKTIPWLPDDVSLYESMVLLGGCSPSSFVLGYSLPNADNFRDVSVTSLRKYMCDPKPGVFVLCYHRREFFRGFMLKSLSANRFKVLNVDSSEVLIVSKSAIHHIPQELCEIHALSIRCTMLEVDDMMKFWSEDLDRIFYNSLRDRPLKVKILKHLDGTSPKYLVELVASCDNHPDVNLSDWINNRLVPDIELYRDLIISEEELVFFLKDESIDPFFHVHTNHNSSILQELRRRNFGGCIPVLQRSETGTEHRSVSSNPELALFDGRSNHLPPLSPGKVLPVKPLVEPYLSCEFDIMDCPDGRNQPCFGNQNKFDGKAEYFTAYCEKKPSSPSLLVYSHLSVNAMDLPRVGDRVNVLVAQILFDLSFYVHLDDEYSHYNDNGIIETYDTLLNRLNNPGGAFRRPSLQHPPVVRQLLIFRNSLNIWCRGLVLEISDDGYFILNPDTGLAETVPNDQTRLRPAEHEDTVLPYQAVLTVLYRTECAEGQDMKPVVNYFASLTLSKKLHAVVRNILLDESITPVLEVELFTADGLNLNKALISTCMCEEVKP